MRITSPRRWHLAHGGRPVVQSGDTKRLAGPFRIITALDDDAAMAVDLRLKSAWYTDRRVREAYALSSNDGTPMDATLWLEAVRAVFLADLSIVTGANKVKLFLAATEPYISGKVGGTEFRQRLSFHEIAQPYHAQDSDLATLTGFVALKSDPVMLPDMTRISLYNDSFKIVSDAGTGVGADYVFALELYGTLQPGNNGSVHPGASACSDSSEDGEASAEEVRTVRQNIQIASANFATSAYGNLK